MKNTDAWRMRDGSPGPLGLMPEEQYILFLPPHNKHPSSQGSTSLSLSPPYVSEPRLASSSPSWLGRSRYEERPEIVRRTAPVPSRPQPHTPPFLLLWSEFHALCATDTDTTPEVSRQQRQQQMQSLCIRHYGYDDDDDDAYDSDNGVRDDDTDEIVRARGEAAGPDEEFAHLLYFLDPPRRHQQQQHPRSRELGGDGDEDYGDGGRGCGDFDEDEYGDEGAEGMSGKVSSTPADRGGRVWERDRRRVWMAKHRGSLLLIIVVAAVTAAVATRMTRMGVCGWSHR
ncbi:hypothetical protein F5X99DRAFT_412938 [Biscogniauxia marginata]|nr:hypothetical protein F5X99DRAFT_412938 [Biscogniauxia marginata]